MSTTATSPNSDHGRLQPGPVRHQRSPQDFASAIAIVLALVALGPLHLHDLAVVPARGRPAGRETGAGPDAPDGPELRPGLDREQIRPLFPEQPYGLLRDRSHHARAGVAAPHSPLRGIDSGSKEVIFYVFLASLAVPALILLIPQYLLLQRLHLLDSLEGLTLLYVSTNLPFSIFFLRAFFERIPRSGKKPSASMGPGP